MFVQKTSICDLAKCIRHPRVWDGMGPLEFGGKQLPRVAGALWVRSKSAEQVGSFLTLRYPERQQQGESDVYHAEVGWTLQFRAFW